MYTLMLDKKNRLIVQRRRLKKTNRRSKAYLLAKVQLLFWQHIINLYLWCLALLQNQKTHRANKKIPIQKNDSMNQRNIFVNISNLVRNDAKTGIQRVGRSILQELLLAPPHGYNIEPIYFEHASKQFRYTDAWLHKNYICDDVLVRNGEVRFGQDDVFFDIDLDYDLVRCTEFEQILVQAQNYGCRVCFVIYDLLPIQIPQHFPSWLCPAHESWLKKVMQFDTATCISKTVAQELTEWIKNNRLDGRKVVNIEHFQLGMDMENSNPTYGLASNAKRIIELLSSRKTFLLVGTIEARKGHQQVLDAFEILWKNDDNINLCFVGKEGWLVEELMDRIRLHPDRGSRFFWLEGASDEYLELVYKASTALIAASYGEGYGLPIIEAARYNIPIIARDIPVFREVAQERAFYFDAQTPEDLAGAINKWINMSAQGSKLSSQVIKIFTWSESTKQLLKAIDIYY